MGLCISHSKNVIPQTRKSILRHTEAPTTDQQAKGDQEQGDGLNINSQTKSTTALTTNIDCLGITSKNNTDPGLKYEFKGEILNAASSSGMSSQRITIHENDNGTDFENSFMNAKNKIIRRSSYLGDSEMRFTDESEDGELTQINQYTVHESLGAGSFGQVFKIVGNEDELTDGGEGATALTSNSSAPCLKSLKEKTYAMKVLNKTKLRKKRVGRFSNALTFVNREIALMKKLRHDNIVKLYEVINDEKANMLYLITEYVDGGPVMIDTMHNDPIPEKQAVSIFTQLIDGMIFLHYQNVAHRDIKPEGVVKICDFGLAMVCEDGENSLSTAGSPAFLAPETVSGEPFDSKTADIWACGITLYVFVVGTVPFVAESLIDMYETIRTQEIKFPETVMLSSSLKDLLTRMLSKDISNRLSLEEILLHPWVSSGGHSSSNRSLLKGTSKSDSFRDLLSETDIKNVFTPIWSIKKILNAKKTASFIKTKASFIITEKEKSNRSSWLSNKSELLEIEK